MLEMLGKFRNEENVQILGRGGIDVSTELILFKSGDTALSVPITPDRETVWLTQDQMSELFDTARSSIAYHIGRVFSEGELNRDTSVEIFDRSTGNASRPPMYYNLDVIISVGYRVKSKRGVEFRKWANGVLKDYILRSYAVNEARIRQLGEVVRLTYRRDSPLGTNHNLGKLVIALEIAKRI